jgi:membrane associated rhomboid family serine protease
MASRGSFESPQRTVQFLLAVNVAVYGLCIMQSGQADIPAQLLFRYGAMYSGALERGEYWRLIAAGFLHGSPLHILGNMLCLALWGGPLERRLGALYFTLVYLSGLVLGGIVSSFTHDGPYISVGASGAISAVLGALLSLRLLGLIALPWNFFVINIGLNIALAFSVSRVDWGAHLGGFAAGMAACVCLDLLERVLAWLLRCKFPEFVKMNGFIVFVMVAAYSRNMAASSRQNILMVALAIIGLAGIKVFDIVLSLKKGLALVAAAFALANPALVLLWRDDIAAVIASQCVGRPASANSAASALCSNIDGSVAVAALAVLAFTVLLYWPQFARGISDVGFIGAGLRGERARRHRL